jgi:antitoxin component YwqK of YwqJK toxin-antitoxin module
MSNNSEDLQKDGKSFHLSGQRKWIGSALLIVLGCILVVFFAFRGSWQGQKEEAPPKPPRELLQSELSLRDGRLYALSEDVPFHGVLYKNFPSGKRKLQIEIEDGKPHGLSIGFFENGQREVEESFIHGVSHGIRTRWNANGKLVSKETIVHGELHGKYIKWYPNGKKAIEMTLVHGKKEGVAKVWNPDGTLKSKTVFKNGVQERGPNQIEEN